jgi:hypothetical protein
LSERTSGLFLSILLRGNREYSGEKTGKQTTGHPKKGLMMMGKTTATPFRLLSDNGLAWQFVTGKQTGFRRTGRKGKE